MSILIPGMKMPQKGKVKMLVLFDDGVLLDNSDGQNQWRAIEIPPHGRLGDLDELHKEAVRRSEKAGICDNWYNCTDHVISASDIEDAPTIIPAEGGADR